MQKVTLDEIKSAVIDREVMLPGKDTTLIFWLVEFS